jgi:hypothetical protein
MRSASASSLIRPHATSLVRAIESPPSSTIAQRFEEGEPARRGARRSAGERASPQSPKPGQRARRRRARLRACAWENRPLPKCGVAPHLRAPPTRNGGFTVTVILYY